MREDTSLEGHTFYCKISVVEIKKTLAQMKTE